MREAKRVTDPPVMSATASAVDDAAAEASALPPTVSVDSRLSRYAFRLFAERSRQVVVRFMIDAELEITGFCCTLVCVHKTFLSSDNLSSQTAEKARPWLP